MTKETPTIQTIRNAVVLAKLGDSVTTDHISPAGAIGSDTPAAAFLGKNGVDRKDFNSYGSRRGNDRVMTRGTFANIRLRNQLAPGTEGGFTKDLTTGDITSIYEASKRYANEGLSSIVFAGKDYGMGSSRDWAAKGTLLLGVKAVVATSFERIHRSNLVGMGVLPLEFTLGKDADSYEIDGTERFSVSLSDDLKPLQGLTLQMIRADKSQVDIPVKLRIDTPVEIDYYRNGGILHTVLRDMLTNS